MHVGHVGEVVVHQRRPCAGEGRTVRARERQAPHEAGVSEFPGRQPFRVGVAPRRDGARDDGNDVGRRRPHVDEQRFPAVACDQRRARMPVGRGDVARMGAHGLEGEEARAPGIKAQRRRRQGRCGQSREGGDALAARREGHRQFPGHRHGVGVGGTQLGPGGSKRLVEPGDVEPERRGDLDRRDEATAFRAGGLEMGAPDVPADHDAHVPIPVLLECAPLSRRVSGSPGMSVVELIPVIDLKGGQVVRAQFGRRDDYRPIQSPLSATSDPIDVARGLLSLYPFETLLYRRSRRDRIGRRKRAFDRAPEGVVTRTFALGRQRRGRYRNGAPMARRAVGSSRDRQRVAERSSNSRRAAG